jgi:TolB-like protein/class 3 adenylate cyclase/Tfp pilus assembly protein PilF
MSVLANPDDHGADERAMEERNVERKLAAILAADVAGYSRLMGADEEGTLAQLKAHRRALIDPKIKEHRGKIIKTTGDGALVEFTSVVDAVRCAVEIQRGMGERNAGVPQAKRIEFRIGINLGDVIHDERDIFGDGVNVAARLEGLAEPGGICVSQGVRDPVRERLGFTFEDMGEQALKNIAAPVHAYRVRFHGPERAERSAAQPARRHNTLAWLGSAATVAALAAVALFLVWTHRGPLSGPAPPAATADSAPLPLPDRPSIAVLPFTNIGGDAKQERLAEGITEDVITDLSRYRALFVIARNSVLTYKGKAVNVPEVGRELGVRYVLEGSIQTNGDRVRVTAQLIEAATDAHVWSERYERPLDDIFEVQNEVTQKIAATIGTGSLLAADAAAARRKPPANLQAYDYYALGTELLSVQTKENFAKAEAFLKKAIELDPQLARAYTSLGKIYDVWGWQDWGPGDPAAWYEKAKTVSLRAIALDPTDGTAHMRLGAILSALGDFDHGFAEFEEALTLNPNDPNLLNTYGGWLGYVGRGKEGVEMVKRSFRLNPHYPDSYNNPIVPFYAIGQYDELINMVRRKKGDRLVQHQMLLVLSYAQLGRQEDVAAERIELLRRYPDFSMERALSDLMKGQLRDQPTRERYLDGARKAGLAECATQAELQKYPKMTHLALCDAKRATN